MYLRDQNVKFEKSNLDIKFLHVPILWTARNWSGRAFQILAAVKRYDLSP